MAFSAELWRSIEPIYAEILAHPFVRGLTDGSLPREAFRFYAVQDALYLRDFARSLSIAAARAPREEWIIMFNEHAAGALKVEMTLHESFFKDFGLSPQEVTPPRSRPPTPRTRRTCSRWPTAGRSTRRSPRCSPATGSTGRWARPSSAPARAI